jgi:hypothetical protein
MYPASSDEEALQYDSSPDTFADWLPYQGFRERQLSSPTAEMRGKPADSCSLIESLIVSARKAKETNQSVYLWNSV